MRACVCVFVPVRRVSQGKIELQRALEKKRWDQRIKASRDQEEEKKNRSPFYQELLKRHQKIEKVWKERALYICIYIFFTTF